MKTLALIGNGRWGSKILETARQMNGCNITHIRTHDYKDLLRCTDLDGIIIATPPKTHNEIIKTFPTQYLLVEKPLTIDYVEACKIKNKNIMVGHQYLYNDALQNLLTNPKEISYFDYRFSNKDSYGAKSLLWELVPHPISLFIYLFGMPLFINATRVKNTIAFDCIYKTLICKGVVGWNSAKKATKITLYKKGKEIVFTDNQKQKTSPLENELSAFLDFIAGKPTKSTLSLGMEVVKVVSIIEQSLRRGKVIGL